MFQQQDLLALCRPKLPNAEVFLLVGQADEGEQRKEGNMGSEGGGKG